MNRNEIIEILNRMDSLIITLARFTAKVRALLFDKDKKTEKEEKKNV